MNTKQTTLHILALRCLFGLLMGFATLSSPAASNTTGLGSPELDAFLEQKMWQMRTPGLAVLVVKDGAVLWAKGYGYADIENQIPVTPDTVFHLASISKCVVATAAMQLWEDGLIGLDDDVNDYLPFPVRSPYFPDVPITFRMLLRHDSSLTRGDPFSLRPDLISFGMDSPLMLADWLPEYLVPGGIYYDQLLGFNTSRPGTVYEYSNIGYALLGYLVERVSGVPFDQYCKLFIFDELDMSDTTYRLADLFADNVAPAVPYIFSHTTQSYFPFGHNASPDYPNGGLRSSANQLAKFFLAHMNGGTFGGTILQPGTVALMHAPVHTNVDAPWVTGYGFGFQTYFQRPLQQALEIGHTGRWYGVVSGMFFRPETGVGVIMLANAAPGIQTAHDATLIWGWEDAGLCAIPERLLDEVEVCE